MIDKGAPQSSKAGPESPRFPELGPRERGSPYSGIFPEQNMDKKLDDKLDPKAKG